jgi:hypothetical protein
MRGTKPAPKCIYLGGRILNQFEPCARVERREALGLSQKSNGGFWRYLFEVSDRVILIFKILNGRLIVMRLPKYYLDENETGMRR